MAGHDSNFLSRWSRRKVQVRQGVALSDDAAAAPPMPAAAGAAAGSPTAVPAVPAAPAAPPLPAQAATEPAAATAPTLADVAALSPQSDYTRFLARGVTPEVKNAALKKLFTDPHFNLMDGLDTYIDDYGKPDPLPAGMLRKMVQSQLLGLFDDEKKAGAAAGSPAALPEPPAAAATTGAVAHAASSCPDAGLDAQCQRQAADDSAPH